MKTERNMEHDLVPLQRGGTNFLTHEIDFFNGGLILKPSLASWLSALIPLVLLVLFTVIWLTTEAPRILVIIAILISLVALLLVFSEKTRTTFINGTVVIQRFGFKGFCATYTVSYSDVGYLQLLEKEFVMSTGRVRKQRCYELNLVLREGGRRSLAQSGKLWELKEIADVLSRPPMNFTLRIRKLE